MRELSCSSFQNPPIADLTKLSRLTFRWAWFYTPENLPRAYRKWIAEIAQVDTRLLRALRNAREGKFVYGRDNGQAEILQGICTEENLPLVWGDPNLSIPIPCEVIHSGSGPSCSLHAASRFIRAFRSSLLMYLSIQVLMKMKQPCLENLQKALRDAVRSSVFLAAFIGMFHYSVCLSRTIIGPHLTRHKLVTSQSLDAGLSIAIGCVSCGFSVFIEHPRRRSELAYFVAPRALSVFLPRRYHRAKVRAVISGPWPLCLVLAEKNADLNSTYGKNSWSSH